MFKNLCCLGNRAPPVRNGGNERRIERRERKNMAEVDNVSKRFFQSAQSSFKGEGLDMSSTKKLTNSFVQKEGVDYVDLRAGEMCEVCTSRPKTHFVVPCGHAACLPCWTTWLFNEANAGTSAVNLQGVATLKKLRKQKPEFSPQQKCFVCQKAVKTIKRYAFDVVPKHPYETADEDYVGSNRNLRQIREEAPESAKEMETFLNASFERFMRALLGVKDELRANIVGKLEEVGVHVADVEARGEFCSQEEREIIFSVENIAVTDAFNAYNAVFNQNDNRNVALWKKLERELKSFQQTLKTLDSFLEERLSSRNSTPVLQQSTLRTKMETNLESSFEDLQEEEADDEVDVLIREEKMEQELPSFNEIKDTLELAMSHGAMTAQWQKVSELMQKVSLDTNLIPNILQSFGKVTVEGVRLDEEFILTVLSVANSSKASVSPQIEELLTSTLPKVFEKVNGVLDSY